ncbi:putative wall-associated receptor kinase-like 16 [Neltuma alba]|uniref:putative wall-associated receptor kinase-like 16 n=1 Tax=Neltuma alba TaxID=207710 RepID=UPI0010A40E74|nr:putative wall-associated receptor kinase-like 16 [Prosopis alba]
MEMMGLILLLVAIAATAGEAQLSLYRDCPHKCGGVDIPYPFGVGDHCSLNKFFNLTCNGSKLYYRSSDIVVSNISLDGQMDIPFYVSPNCYNQAGGKIRDKSFSASLEISAFPVSSSANKFVSVGCDTYGYLNSFLGEQNYSTGCLSRCNGQLQPTAENTGETCSGIGCCQIDIPPRMKNITIESYSFDKHQNVWAFNNCSYAFVAKKGSFNFSPRYLEHLPFEELPLVLDWFIANASACQEATALSTPNSVCNTRATCQNYTTEFGYRCLCKRGYQGNPYHPDGCQDVNECDKPNDCDIKGHAQCNNFNGSHSCSCPPGYTGDGYLNGTRCTLDATLHSNPNLLSLIIALGVCATLLVGFTLVSMLCWAHKQRTQKLIRERNFERNGGNVLLQRLSQQQGYADRTKIFNQVELQNATDNFDEDRILGRGGQGTVYKGILADNTPVAIKKSRVGGDPRQIKDFINEVVVLSQINHRNVVKLLGCCLETEVPLLVYEFVDNGTLLDHINPSKNEFFISWETRLRIAAETAEAISYLHSAASIPIIHRDIKSTNILLDHNHRAKVSDFGASRLVPLDETQAATVVQGTLGYLDPEYLLTGQLNEKSDVYSFGVVLVELLTGNKAVEFNRPEQPNLAMSFVSSIKEDRLWEILDRQLLDQKKNAAQLKEVAFLARRCIRINGEERPTMKEVAMELEGLIAMERHPWMKGRDAISEETEYLLVHVPDEYGAASTSNSSGYDTMQKQMAFEIEDGR